ncbi:hypothetical protein DPMN_107646 [Dreissena polymorpha]|uniref:Uncharacterized protein n=1 Tax=Dreissena polymorpha TaxID=45954 RepID=A0A9D4K760_DREPO|nr:hypothetical protein DPMN_107646 [Dreissena polymorpha]
MLPWGDFKPIQLPQESASSHPVGNDPMRVSNVCKGTGELLNNISLNSHIVTWQSHRFHEDANKRPCFSTNWNHFELVQDIIGTNLLTKINAPTPDIIGINLLTKFHEDWTINVASRVLTRQMLMLQAITNA